MCRIILFGATGLQPVQQFQPLGIEQISLAGSPQQNQGGLMPAGFQKVPRGQRIQARGLAVLQRR